VATAISEDRVIVGWCEVHGRTTAFEFRLGTGVLFLRGLPGSSADRAHGVNLSGEVVGESDGKAVRWLPDSSPEVIPGLRGGSRSVALTIDERGDVSGLVWFGSRKAPFFWDRSLGTRIGIALVPPGIVSSRPLLRVDGFRAMIRDSNRAGSALLAFETTGNAPTAALIRPDGRLWRLPPAWGGAGVQALDVSDTCDRIVGATITTAGLRRATWWRREC
jgi:hypothetical protein